MKKSLLLVVSAVFLTGAPFVLPPKAAAKQARCLLVVDDVTYVNGQCTFNFIAPDSVSLGGSFNFDDNRLKTRCAYHDLPYSPSDCTMAARQIVSRGTFGSLWITRPGIGRINWNEGNSTHAQAVIEPVYRNGACWQNSRAKLCAW